MLQQRQHVLAARIEQVARVGHGDLSVLGDEGPHFVNHLLVIFGPKDDIGSDLFQLSQFDQRHDHIFADFDLTFFDRGRAIGIIRKAPHQPLDFGLLIAIKLDLMSDNCQCTAHFDDCIFNDQFLDQCIENAWLEFESAFEFLARYASS